MLKDDEYEIYCFNENSPEQDSSFQRSKTVKQHLKHITQFLPFSIMRE